MNNFCKKINNTLLWLSAIIYCCPSVFAEQGDIPTDEFIQDALQVNLPENAENAENLAETDMAAEQLEDVAANAGSNIFVSFKDHLQDFGNSIGHHLEKITGGNPFITKLLVGLVLVLISIVVIVVLVLIAKKFVFKNKTSASKNLFEQKRTENSDDEEEYEEYEEEYEEVEDDDSETEQQPQQQTTAAKEQPSVPSTPKTMNIDLPIDEDEPESIQDAITKFLSVTE